MNMFQKGFLVLVLVVMGFALIGCGGNNATPAPTQTLQSENVKLVVRDPWSRPALKGDNGAAFFTVDNGLGQPVGLTSANGDIAATVEVHLSKMEVGVMKMEPQERVEIPAKGKLEFKPGSYHIMLINLSRDLKIGDTFNLNLVFDTGETLPIIVTVKEP